MMKQARISLFKNHADSMQKALNKTLHVTLINVEEDNGILVFIINYLIDSDLFLLGWQFADERKYAEQQ